MLAKINLYKNELKEMLDVFMFTCLDYEDIYGDSKKINYSTSVEYFRTGIILKNVETDYVLKIQYVDMVYAGEKNIILLWHDQKRYKLTFNDPSETLKQKVLNRLFYYLEKNHIIHQSF